MTGFARHLQTHPVYLRVIATERAKTERAKNVQETIPQKLKPAKSKASNIHIRH